MDFTIDKPITYRKVTTRAVRFEPPDEDFHLRVRLAGYPHLSGWRIEVEATDYNPFGCPSHVIEVIRPTPIAEAKRRLPEILARLLERYERDKEVP